MERRHSAVARRARIIKEKIESISKESVKGFLGRNVFVLFTIIAMSMGVILGFVLRPRQLSMREIKYFAFPGEMLKRMLHMMVLPLVASSLVTGISSLDTKTSSKMGMRALVYYTSTTLLAVFIGIVLVISIKPGKGNRVVPVATTRNVRPFQAADTFLDLVRNMIPSNLVAACVSQYKTAYRTTVHTRNVTVTLNLTNALNLTDPNLNKNLSRVLHYTQETVKEYVPVPGTVPGINALGLVIFCMCFGLVIGHMKQEGHAIKAIFHCMNEAIMRMVAVIRWYAPVGILFLIAEKIIEMKDMAEVGSEMGLYAISIILGLFIHGLIALPMIYFVITRKNPLVFITGLMQALITALGTSSSSATLPITYRCLEEYNRLDKRVTRFILPVGATINMDGTALYEAVAAIFIAQINDRELNFGQIVTIGITATAASIGAAGIPQAGLVTMVIVVTSVGLPTEDIAMIVAVDWFLDRFCTAVNVMGDSFGAGIVEHLSRRELKKLNVEVDTSITEDDDKSNQFSTQDNDAINQVNNETTKVEDKSFTG